MIRDHHIHIIATYFGFERVPDKEEWFNKTPLPRTMRYENDFGYRLDFIPVSLARSECLLYSDIKGVETKKFTDMAQLVYALANLPEFSKIR